MSYSPSRFSTQRELWLQFEMQSADVVILHWCFTLHYKDWAQWLTGSPDGSNGLRRARTGLTRPLPRAILLNHSLGCRKIASGVRPFKGLHTVLILFAKFDKCLFCKVVFARAWMKQVSLKSACIPQPCWPVRASGSDAIGFIHTASVSVQRALTRFIHTTSATRWNKVREVWL